MISALAGYGEVVALLRPLVVSSQHPRRDDAERCLEAARQPVAYFIREKKFDRAREYFADVSVIPDTMIARDPDEPEYLRWRADGLLLRATALLGAGSTGEAGEALRGYVESIQAVHRMVGNDYARQDLAAALERAVRMAGSLPPGTVPAKEWRELADRLR